MQIRILFLFGFAVLIIGACSTDECKKIKCQNNGVCNDGYCMCPDGFEGKYCEIAWRDNYIGVYAASENCSSSSPSNYTITITANTTFPERIDIHNLYNTNQTIVAIVESPSSVSIVNQAFGSGQISGSGYLGTNTISFSFNVTSGTSTESCSATCLKQ